jgi:hypothetical protein
MLPFFLLPASSPHGLTIYKIINTLHLFRRQVIILKYRTLHFSSRVLP